LVAVLADGCQSDPHLLGAIGASSVDGPSYAGFVQARDLLALSDPTRGRLLRGAGAGAFWLGFRTRA